jgi:cytoskeletal protein RodZ
VNIVVVVEKIVVIVIISVENRPLVDREETSIGVRRKRKAKKNTKIILEKEKKGEKRKESRLTLAVYMTVLFIPSPWSVFDSSVTFVHFVRNEYRSQNISMWQS